MNRSIPSKIEGPGLLLWAIVVLALAAAYFAIVLMGLLFGITGPARWLAEDVLIIGCSALPFLTTVVEPAGIFDHGFRGFHGWRGYNSICFIRVIPVIRGCYSSEFSGSADCCRMVTRVFE